MKTYLLTSATVPNDPRILRQIDDPGASPDMCYRIEENFDFALTEFEGDLPTGNDLPYGTRYFAIMRGNGELFDGEDDCVFAVIGEIRNTDDELEVISTDGEVIYEFGGDPLAVAVYPPEMFGLARFAWWDQN